MNGQIITVALILLGHIFLTPAVQAIGFDYYNDHGVMSYGKGYGEDEKIIAQFPKMNRADLRLVTNISGERELVEGYIPTDEISIKNGSCIQCVDAPSNVVLTFNESANDPVMHFC